MAELHESSVALRIGGDNLLPHEITRLLGCEPTRSGEKGEVMVGKKTAVQRKLKTGTWILKAAVATPGNVDGQANEILGKLTQDMEVWRSLSSQYDMDLFCGLMMKYGDEGLEISSNTLQELGARGIRLGLCLYGPLRGDIKQEPR